MTLKVDISMLPPLPSPVEATDLIPVKRTSGTYKASVSELEESLAVGGKGVVYITDITATNPSDNVGGKIKTDDNNVLQSCTSSTANITVSVLAVTGSSSFKPVVVVNGVTATLVRNALTDVWQGTAAITLVGGVVTATHSDGAVDTADVTIESAPVVNTVLFSGAYSQGGGQSEHASGQTLSLTITSATPFVEVDIVGDGTTATTALTQTFAAATSKTFTVTAANHGNTANAYPAKVRIRNANGTWSAVKASNTAAAVDGTNVITLNNVRPVVAFTSITYPASQTALKSSEQATVSVSESNVNTVLYSSPNGDLSITNPSTTGTKTVTRIAGSYNIATDNLSVTAGRTLNATTAIFSTVVWIATAPITCAITIPAARLRSSPSGLDHTVTLTFSQRVASPTLTASVGAWQGVWATANNGVTWTRSLRITDAMAKGAATFSALSTTNLANIAVSTITSGASYTVGGFVARTVTMAATPNREVLIGTLVVDTAKLLVTNFSKGGAGVAMTYQGSTADGVDKFTITGTNTLLYNCDAANADSNFSGTAQFSIEETVA